MNQGLYTLVCLVLLSIQAAGDLDYSVNPPGHSTYPGASVEYTITITNNETSPVTLEFQTGGLSRGFSVAVVCKKKTLSPGESVDVRTVVTANEDAFPGSHSIDVVASSARGPTQIPLEYTVKTCTEERVDADLDGSFEHCGCDTDGVTRNGYVCQDGSLTGVCVGSVCDTAEPASFNCGADGCSPADSGSVARVDCTRDGFEPNGWACDASFSSFTANYFTQDGICAIDPLTWEVVCASPVDYNFVCRTEWGEYYADDCDFMCFDGNLCDTNLIDGDFQATGTCLNNACTGPLPQEELVNADFSADGSCEREGCDGNCNGCICDSNRDGTPDGICVGEDCVAFSPIVLDCDDECYTSDTSSPGFTYCYGHEGLACLEDVWGITTGSSWRYSYFPQDGLCGADPWGLGISMCASFPWGGHVCLNNGNVYAHGCGLVCDDGDPCDRSMEGNFDSGYGTCLGDFCNSLVCTEEFADTDFDGVAEVCGCDNLQCSGCICDQDRDGTTDGICVYDSCVTAAPVSMSCRQSCGIEDILANIQAGCAVDTGFSCDNDFVTPGQTYFTQDGLCAEVDGSGHCVTSGHVCFDSAGIFHGSCSDCSDGDKCDAILTDGDFDPVYGKCSAGACEEYVLPETFDWRNRDGEYWLTSVKHQGSCGACWAFATIGTMEAKYMIEQEDTSFKPDLSEQYLISDCCSTGDCSGGSGHAFGFIMGEGVPDEACYPYQGIDTDCDQRCADWESRLWNLTTYSGTGSVERNVKIKLMEEGPMYVHMTTAGLGDSDGDGVWTCTGTNINHAAVLVGWNDTGGYWIIKNSWGLSWGDKGFFNIKYGHCRIPSTLTYVEGVNSP